MYETLAIASLVIVSLTTGVLLSLFYTGLRYVPFVPSKRKIAKKMVKLAEIRDGDEVFDLGCGDGRLLHIASEEKEIKAIGVEVSLFVYWTAKVASKLKKKNIKILRKNFFDVDLKNADIVFCYLFPKVMKKLQKKFEQELKPGAKVISNCFPIKAWKPSRLIQTREDKPENFLIYQYDIPQAYEG